MPQNFKYRIVVWHIYLTMEPKWKTFWNQATKFRENALAEENRLNITQPQSFAKESWQEQAAIERQIFSAWVQPPWQRHLLHQLHPNPRSLLLLPKIETIWYPSGVPAPNSTTEFCHSTICTFDLTTDYGLWRHKSKISEKLGQCGRQNMLRPYLTIWD